MSAVGSQSGFVDEATPATTKDPRRLLSFSARRVAGVVVAVLTVVASVLVTARPALNGDVTYAFGGMETAGEGGVSIWDVFVARPLIYRLLVGGLDVGRSLFVGDAASVASQRVVRAETDLLAVAVAVVLFLGVRRFLGARAGAVVAVATGLALIVSPPWHFLEPDWAAALAAVLAVGAACAPRRIWAGAVLGGLAAALVIAVKLATAPLAVLAIVLVAVLHWRRAAWMAGATAGWAVVWYALTKHFLPWEWIWLRDQADLVDNSPIHHGLRWADIHHLIIATGDVAILSPLVAVAPAAAAVLVRRAAPGRARWIAAGVAVAAAGLAVASAYGQGEFFMYHFAVVPVLAAGVCAAAFALSAPARMPLIAVTAVFAATSFVLLRRPPAWRHDHVTVVVAAYVLGAIVAAVLVWLADGRTARPVPPAFGVVVLSGALVLATLPGAPYAFSTANYALHNNPPALAGYAQLSQRIGRDTPVMYLTFGAVNYGMGNPTACRYPSPQWLQRGTAYPRVRDYPSYVDNLRCLTEDKEAEYLIVQTQWFPLQKADPQVRSLIEEKFDCSPAARIPAPSILIVCPARAH